MKGKIAWTFALGSGVYALSQWLRQKRRMSFAGKTVLITGGSRGLGLGLARLFADEGANIAILARDGAELGRAREELAGRGAQVLSVVCDVTDFEGVQQAVERVVGRFGALHVLVNNAGIIQVGPLEHMTLDDWNHALDINLKGPLHLSLACLPHLKAAAAGTQEGARIVNITSLGGKIALPHMAPYAASKFGMVGLSDALRAELYKDNIFVSTVCPGPMRTGSHVNAYFKGQHAKEYAGFAAAAGTPGNSMAGDRAAQQIFEACRYGEAQLILPLMARLATTATHWTPRLVACLMALAGRHMPGPVGESGDEVRTGWQSQGDTKPHLLSRLADDAIPQFNELNGHAAEFAPDNPNNGHS